MKAKEILKRIQTIVDNNPDLEVSINTYGIEKGEETMFKMKLGVGSEIAVVATQYWGADHELLSPLLDIELGT